MPSPTALAQPNLAHLLTSLLSSPSLSPSRPIPDNVLLALAAVVGNQTLLDALDLIDRDNVSRLTPPAGRPIYLVASSSGAGGAGGSYHVLPDIKVGGSAGGWCPCPAFARGVVGGGGGGGQGGGGGGGDAVICKHLLAVLLSLRLSPSPSTTTTSKPSLGSSLSSDLKPDPTAPSRAQGAITRPSTSSSAFVEKRATLEWVAGWATKFGAAVPPPPPAGAAGGAAGSGDG
ncbi:hypothetical protein JCM6882_000657 [Rhodosporidiobolus microsporus]